MVERNRARWRPSRSSSCIRLAAVLACLAALISLPAGGAPGASALALAPDADAIVRCDPQSASASILEQVVIDLYVQDVADLYGVDLEVTFNTSIVQVIDQDAGSSGVQITPLASFLSPDFTLFRAADNTAGTIHYATTQLNPALPKSGSGPVARITFQPMQAGIFQMNFTFHQLGDRDGVEIPSVAQSCLVEILEVTGTDVQDFHAAPSGSRVALGWETLFEYELARFDIYRSEAGGEPILLSGDGIAPQGPGNAYRWIDMTARPGVAYDYWLAYVTTGGQVERYGPVSVTTPNYQNRLMLPLLAGAG